MRLSHLDNTTLHSVWVLHSALIRPKISVIQLKWHCAVNWQLIYCLTHTHKCTLHCNALRAHNSQMCLGGNAMIGAYGSTAGLAFISLKSYMTRM